LNAVSHEIKKKDISQEYPRPYGRAAYVSVKDRARQDGKEVLLLRCASEGSYSYSIIADIEGQEAHYYDEKAQTIDFDGNHIWIGKSNGLALLNRVTDIIEEYLVLPYFSKDSKILKTDAFYLITHDRLGVEMVDPDANTIQFLTLDDIIKASFPQDTIPFTIRGLPYFTNMIDTKEEVLLGCRLIDDEKTGKPSEEGSYLLAYDKARNTWSMRHLEREGLFRLLKIKNRMILVFNLIVL